MVSGGGVLCGAHGSPSLFGSCSSMAIVDVWCCMLWLPIHAWVNSWFFRSGGKYSYRFLRRRLILEACMDRSLGDSQKFLRWAILYFNICILAIFYFKFGRFSDNVLQYESTIKAMISPLENGYKNYNVFPVCHEYPCIRRVIWSEGQIYLRSARSAVESRSRAQLATNHGISIGSGRIKQ